MNYWINPGLAKDDSLEEILNEICRLTDTKPDDIKSKSRKQEIVIVRQVYCCVARDITGATMREIGNVIHRDHVTVIHSCKVIEEFISVGDKMVLQIFENLKINFDLKTHGRWRENRGTKAMKN